MFSKEGITLGEFGLFVIIAYATGQLLLQAVVEAVGWHAERARAGCSTPALAQLIRRAAISAWESAPS